MSRASLLPRCRSALVVAFTLLMAVSPHAGAAPPELTAVKVGATSDPQIGGPWVIAREKGFFAQEGLTQGDVAIFPSGPASFPPFVSGDIQGDSTGDQPMLTQAAGGVPLKLVAIYSEISGVHGITGSSAIRTITDLEGKKVALQKGSTAEWYMRNTCKQLGCDI